jgi:hypothetical protein
LKEGRIEVRGDSICVGEAVDCVPAEPAEFGGDGYEACRLLEDDEWRV